MILDDLSAELVTYQISLTFAHAKVKGQSHLFTGITIVDITTSDGNVSALALRRIDDCICSFTDQRDPTRNFIAKLKIEINGETEIFSVTI